MKTIYLNLMILLTFGSIIGSCVSCEKNQRRPPNPNHARRNMANSKFRIGLGGIKQEPMPFTVQIYSDVNDTFKFECGGMVVGADSIMTATICAERAEFKARQIFVSIGNRYADLERGDKLLMKVRRIHRASFINPDDGIERSDGDIVILELVCRMQMYANAIFEAMITPKKNVTQGDFYDCYNYGYGGNRELHFMETWETTHYCLRRTGFEWECCRHCFLMWRDYNLCWEDIGNPIVCFTVLKRGWGDTEFVYYAYAVVIATNKFVKNCTQPIPGEWAYVVAKVSTYYNWVRWILWKLDQAFVQNKPKKCILYPKNEEYGYFDITTSTRHPVRDPSKDYLYQDELSTWPPTWKPEESPPPLATFDFGLFEG